MIVQDVLTKSKRRARDRTGIACRAEATCERGSCRAEALREGGWTLCPRLFVYKNRQKLDEPNKKQTKTR